MASSKSVIRGCVDVGAGGISGCASATMKDVPKEFLNELTGGAVSGDVCYCNTDMCVAKPCENGFILLNAWYVDAEKHLQA